MGPYALRSVNAYFKLWDEGVQDSFEENLSQAPVNEIPNMDLSICQCWTTPGGCGGVVGSACQPGFRYSTHSCNPQGSACDGAPTSACTQDSTCCAPIAESCGNNPLPLGPGGTYTVPNNDTSPPCYLGQRLWASTCSPNTSTPTCSATVTTNCIPASYCQQDSTCPGPTCTGSLPVGALFCTSNGAAPATDLLDRSYPIVEAPGGVCPSSHTSPGTYCYYYFTCPTGTKPDGQGNCEYEVAPAPTVTTLGATCPTAYPSICSCSQSPTPGNPAYTSTTVTCSTSFCSANSNPFTSVCSQDVSGGTSCSPQGTGCANGSPCGCGNPGTPNTWCSLIYTY